MNQKKRIDAMHKNYIKNPLQYKMYLWKKIGKAKPSDNDDDDENDIDLNISTGAVKRKRNRRKKQVSDSGASDSVSWI